jgi:hypothetical protein
MKCCVPIESCLACDSCFIVQEYHFLLILPNHFLLLIELMIAGVKLCQKSVFFLQNSNFKFKEFCLPVGTCVRYQMLHG